MKQHQHRAFSRLLHPELERQPQHTSLPKALVGQFSIITNPMKTILGMQHASYSLNCVTLLLFI